MGFSIASIFILFAFVSCVLLFLGSLKLIKSENIPGSKLIFIAVIGAFISGFIPEAETEEGEVIFLWQVIEISTHSILILLASYGFYKLSNYVASISANKAIKKDV